MGKTIKAGVANGRLEPLEPLGMCEGEVVTLTIVSVPSDVESDGFERAAGGWKGTIDAEALIRNVYEDRLIHTRPEPKL
jgi:predicted DNA-binding antitoxin AbrB/MazE fold protein